MSNNEIFFTDVVKDVIGNDPVLDQFDTYYEASFYGTMQDDYITGSMLKYDSKNKNFVVSTGASDLGTRGRAFSTYYAEIEPPLESTFGSAGVALNPYLSKRVTPWKERTSSTSYRLVQSFDDNERYFDSCLPNFKTCLAANGSELWSSDPNAKLFSPYGNVSSGSVGYIFFNSYKTDRTNEGFVGDPIVDNDWTWSYPFEGKYKPQTRIVKSSTALGLSESSLTANYFSFFSDLEDSLDVIGLSRSTKPIELKGVFPILPGYLPQTDLPSGGRNSFRTRYVPPADQFDLLGQVNRIPASYSASGLDDSYGFSFLIPSDVDLSNKEDHSWLTPYPWISIPSPDYLTGTMSTDDITKLLFGFGDLNNMTYGFRLFNSSSAALEYSEGFNRINPADSRKFFAYNVPSATTTYLKVNWANSPSIFKWSYVYKDGSTLGSNYISGSNPFAGYGLYWNDNGVNPWVLLSDTSTVYGGGMPQIGVNIYSICCADITSSVPWSLKYNRGIAANSSSYFISYFSGIPGFPSQELPLGPFQIVVPLDFATGSGNAIRHDTLTEYNSKTDTVFDSNTGKTVDGTDLFPFPPGEWRLNFAFVHTGGPVGIGSSGAPVEPDIAAIKDVQITTFGPNCFPPDNNGQKIGCNNYPEFRTKRCDPRYNPVLSLFGATTSQVTSSANFYQGYVFGISPIIRGWKYGLYNAFPTHSKAIFRRDKYGQFRDMLEQRPYTKFINVASSPLDNDAITDINFNNQLDSKSSTYAEGSPEIGPPTVSVNFVKQRYKKNEKGVGYIYNEKVDPSQTLSQNLSYEVTSSLPYFDGVARHRQEEDLNLVNNANITSLKVESSGLTVV